MPRFMVIVPASEESERGELPPPEALDAMTAFNEELAEAGLMLEGNGLHPSSDGARVKFSGGKVSVIDGPFTEAKELIAGYWLLEAKDRNEVVEWMKRAPFAEFSKQAGEVVLQIRQVFELDEFGEGPEIDRARALEEKIREKERSE